MYNIHQPIISEYSRSSSENMLNTFKFVFCTIQQSLDEAVKQAQGLVNNGMAWQLQGSYGRTAKYLIEEGIINVHNSN